MQFSKMFNLLFEDSVGKFYSLPPEHFKDTLCNILKSITFKPVEAAMAPETSEQTTQKKKRCVNLTLVNNAASRYDTVDDKLFQLETIQSTLERIHNQSSSTTEYTNCSDAPILEITQASASELRTLLKLFKADVLDIATEKEMSIELLKFIPIAPIQNQPPREGSASVCMDCSFVNFCSWCKRECCEHHPLQSCSYPRTGLGSSTLCSECISYNKHEDANEWAQASLNFLAQPNDESIIASLGCALMAIALGFDSQKMLKSIAKILHRQGLNTVAYSILQPVMSLSKELEPKLYFLASFILRDLVKQEKITSKEKFTLALASKESFDAALTALDKNTEMPYSEVRKKEIEDLVCKLFKERMLLNLEEGKVADFLIDMAHQFDSFKMSNEEVRLKLQRSTLPPDLMQILDLLLTFKEQQPGLVFSDLPLICKQRMELLFLPSSDELPPLVDLASLISNISNKPGSFIDNLLDTSMQIGLDHFHITYSIDLCTTPALKKLTTPDLAHTKCKDESTSISLPSDEELTPPFGRNLPTIVHKLSVKHFEENIMHLFLTKKWSNMQVASAYIDVAHACESQVEKVICYLLAAMWMARNFNSDSKYPTDVIYGYKSIIMKLLLLSCETALYYCCNPGLELYVIRLAIGIIKKITQVPNSQLVFTEEDAFFLQRLLQRLFKVSNMNSPFFYHPPISLSEAVLSHNIIAKLHSTFIYELQFINSKHRLLEDVDLMYQLYHNDLFSILPLKNSSDSRARAMDELLKSQGLSWNDVRQTMSTPLCLRDEEGWLIQSPELGVPQQYSKLVGFVFDANKDEPSLKLLVVEADPKTGNRGLFSQEDINAMLQLDLEDDALFFSLDPPSNDLDKSFHPFQQWRHSEKIKGTEVLNTMFITDYLMKSFVTDTDISSMPPFKQRSCKDGLIKHLPPELQNAIRPTQERLKSSQPKHYRSRFWIESKEVNYMTSEDGSKYEYYFGEVDMEVKSESSPFGIDLTLPLTEQNSPDSPHISFSRDMTEHYSELSEYFPVFARLRELSKLQFFSIELQSLVETIKKKRPEKAASLTRYIETYKQPQAQINTCTWVPAVTSPKIRSVHYGGVQLSCRGANFYDPRQELSFIPGCYGNELLQKAYKSLADMLDSSVFRHLGGVVKPNDSLAIDCTKQIRGFYLIEQAKKLCFGSSVDVFRQVRQYLEGNKDEDIHFGVLEMNENITISDPFVHSATKNFLSEVEKRYGNIVDYCPPSHSTAHNMVDTLRGVRFSREGVQCQSDKEFGNVTAVSVQIKPATNAKKLENVSYSPPVGEVEMQRRTSHTRFNSWNKAISDKNESSLLGTSNASRELPDTVTITLPEQSSVTVNKAEIIQSIQEVIEELSSALAEQRVTLSTFRQNNSTELNKHLDRLYHSLYTGLPESFQPITE